MKPILFIIVFLIITIFIIKPKVIRMRVKKYQVGEKTALASFSFYHTDHKQNKGKTNGAVLISGIKSEQA